MHTIVVCTRCSYDAFWVTPLQEKIVANANIPGFQKLSLIYLPDVGKTPVSYQLRYVRRPSDLKVVEDRVFNIRSVVDGYLGEGLVDTVEYNGKEPNRCTVRCCQADDRDTEFRVM